MSDRAAATTDGVPPLLLVSGVAALLPLVSHTLRPISLPHLAGEAVGITLAVIALAWLAWVARSLLEQRW